MVLGHEGSGKILKIGADVKNVKEGQGSTDRIQEKKCLYTVESKTLGLKMRLWSPNKGDAVSFEPGYPVVNDEFTKSGKYNLTKVGRSSRRSII